jgi:hypothetical protein
MRADCRAKLQACFVCCRLMCLLSVVLTKSAEAHTLALCLSSAQQWNVVVMLTFIRSSGPPLYTRLVLYQSAELMHTLDRSSALADMQECSFEACPTRFRELLMSAAAAAPTNSHVTTLDLQCHRRLATADVPCWGRLTGAQGRPECNLLAELSTVLPESASQSARMWRCVWLCWCCTAAVFALTTWHTSEMTRLRVNN